MVCCEGDKSDCGCTYWWVVQLANKINLNHGEQDIYRAGWVVDWGSSLWAVGMGSFLTNHSNGIEFDYC